MWKVIEGYPKYEVSDDGEVRVVKSGKILKKSVDTRGYYKVTLTNSENRKTLFVHRLVAIAFMSNPNNLNQVNHIDENKDNNFAINLEWCSWNYNLKYGTRIQRVAKKKAKPIRQYSLNGILIAEYLSIREAERQTGFCNTNISACCNRKLHHNTQYGYIWRFKEDDEYENKN